MTNRPNCIAGGKVTIKDISARLGISSTTVHRALAGKEGMTDALRQKILDTAREMGYEINYAAASIKRRTLRIAVVVPQDDGCYFANIWKGVYECAEEARRLNIDVETYVCDDERHEYQILKSIADAGPREYAGVLAYSYSRMPEVMIQLQRLVDLKIKTSVIDDIMTEPQGICCIPAYQACVGELAAEITATITPEEGTILITEGRTDSMVHTEKLRAYRKYLERTKPGLKIVTIPGYPKTEKEGSVVRESILKAFAEHGDVVLYYAQNSLDTRLAVKVFRELGSSRKFARIGTDLNEYTAQYLRDGELTLVIDQGAYAKGYMGLSTLVDSLAKHIEPDTYIDTPLDVVYRSNLRFYERAKKLYDNGGQENEEHEEAV